MQTYRAALIGCSRMGAFIDNEVPSDWGAYSHAAGYEACPRTKLVACADLRPEAMHQTGLRYGIPAEQQYTDYLELLDKVKPDILSVATQPEQRAAIILAAAERGVGAIYAEKALAASTAEAEAIASAVEAKGIFLNMGTNRRWDPGYDAMKGVIDSGQLGQLKSLIIHQTSTLFNGASHSFDLLMRLNSDAPVNWAQAHLPGAEAIIEGHLLREDPLGHGIIQFANGVIAYALNSGRGLEVEAVCEKGVVTALGNGKQWVVRQPVEQDHRGRDIMGEVPFPNFTKASSTQRLIEDLVAALDGNGPPRGGARLAQQNTELIFAFIESHQRGGARVTMPLGPCPYRLERQQAPRQPKYQR